MYPIKGWPAFPNSVLIIGPSSGFKAFITFQPGAIIYGGGLNETRLAQRKRGSDKICRKMDGHS